jgi:serine protease Do
MKKQLTIAVLILISINISLSQSNLKEMIAKNEKAIFSIFTYDDFGVPSGSGTGFFIEASGIGISNYHVMEGASSAIIKMTDNKTLKIVEILESNPDADLIKFKVENSTGVSFPYLSTKNSLLQKGEDIFVIGNPHGFESTVSEGIISSIREVDGYEEVIQITAPISPGSSGSPVMTLDGKIIGVATFQYKEGQNLNFAVSSKMINRLTPKNKLLNKSGINSNFLVINERCEENTELVLNSIEFKYSETIVNFSFTNVSIGYGDYMLIWSKLNTKNETFFIQDLNSMKKYYAIDSDIGSNRIDGTRIALGETKRFSIKFPPIPKNIGNVNIMEGLSSSWNFIGLDLSNYLNIENQEVEDYSLQFALTKLENKEFQNAKLLLSDHVENNRGDSEAYNAMGIISYVMDNNYDALKYFGSALEVNPKNDIYYFNRYSVYMYKKKDFDNALNDISYAIKNRPNQGDYYQHRAYVYMALKEWGKAIGDLSIALNLMDNHWHILKLRGTCKAMLTDSSGACKDWQESYELSGKTDEEVKGYLEKYCE